MPDEFAEQVEFEKSWFILLRSHSSAAKIASNIWKARTPQEAFDSAIADLGVNEPADAPWHVLEMNRV